MIELTTAATDVGGTPMRVLINPETVVYVRPCTDNAVGKTDVFFGSGRACVMESFDEVCALLTTSNPTGIEAQVAHDLAERQQRGIAKYGTTMDDNPNLAPAYWLQHAYEECLDQAIYLKKLLTILGNADADQ